MIPKLLARPFLALNTVALFPNCTAIEIHRHLTEDVPKGLKRTFISSTPATTYGALRILKERGYVKRTSMVKSGRDEYRITAAGMKVCKELHDALDEKRQKFLEVVEAGPMRLVEP